LEGWWSGRQGGAGVAWVLGARGPRAAQHSQRSAQHPAPLAPSTLRVLTELKASAAACLFEQKGPAVPPADARPCPTCVAHAARRPPPPAPPPPLIERGCICSVTYRASQWAAPRRGGVRSRALLPRRLIGALSTAPFALLLLSRDHRLAKLKGSPRQKTTARCGSLHDHSSSGTGRS
jgi:hypothetical protein